MKTDLLFLKVRFTKTHNFKECLFDAEVVEL